MARCVHLSAYLRSITVEPIMFLYMMSIFTTYPAFQALLYRKLCISNYNTSFCDLMMKNKSMFAAEGDLIQTQTSHWILYSNVALTVPSCIVSLFILSTLIDKVSHKLSITITIMCAILHSVSNLIGSIYMEIPVAYLLIGSIINGLGGAFVAMMMVIYSYITIIATERNKTLRVSIVESMIFIAGTIGVFTSGLMVDHLGFIFTFSFTTGLLVLVMFYVIIWLPDIKPEVTTITNENRICSSLLSRFYGILEFVRKDREARKKLFMWLMIFVLLLVMLSTSAEMDIMYLYVSRRPIAWSRTKFGYLKGLENFLRGITLITILPVLKFKFHMKDTMLIFIGLVSKAIGLILYSVGYLVSWFLFLGAATSMLMGFSAAGIRSSVSLLVDKDEHGRLFGLIASLESIASLVATVSFNEIYPESFTFFPGFCFILAAAIIILSGIVVLWLHFAMPVIQNSYSNLELSESTSDVDDSSVVVN